MKEKRLRSILFFSLFTVVICSNVNVKAAEDESPFTAVEKFLSHLEEINFQELTDDLSKPEKFSFLFWAFRFFEPEERRVLRLKNNIISLKVDKSHREGREELKIKLYSLLEEESNQKVIQKAFNSLTEERKERQKLVTSVVAKIRHDIADGSMNEEEPPEYFKKLTDLYHPRVAGEALNFLVRERNKNSNEEGK